MVLRRPLFRMWVALLAVVALAGCPPQPLLSVSPSLVALGASDNQALLSVRNDGEGVLWWRVEELVRASADAEYEVQDIPWLSTEPGPDTSTADDDTVTLTVDRTGLSSGNFGNVAVRVTSSGGDEIIPISMVVSDRFSVRPSVVTPSETAISTRLALFNSSQQAVEWTVSFLSDPDDLSTAGTLPTGVQVTPNGGSTLPAESSTIEVSWNADRQNLNLLFSSDSGEQVVRFLFGGQLDDFVVEPANEIRLFVETAVDGAPATQPVTEVTIRNTGSTDQNWDASITSFGFGGEALITVTPSTGTLTAGSSATLELSVTDGDLVQSDVGAYALSLQSGDGFVEIPIVIDLLRLPEILVSAAPDPEAERPQVESINTLDFGRDTLQVTFWIANARENTSWLYFRVSHEDQGSDFPVIASVTPQTGDTNAGDSDFYYPSDSDTTIDGTSVTVTINRDNLTESEETRTITIEAMDEDFIAPLAGVDPVTLTLRVERPPMVIEGAMNRARPPYMMRFVFSLRDSLGKVIPVLTQSQRDRVSFSIEENDVPLDLDETSRFTTGPTGDFKGNAVLMLDFTSSILNAGLFDAGGPFSAGEVLADIRAAADQFIDDLPAGWQLALMYHNDRQQDDYLIHPLTKDKDALKDALAAFTLPDAHHGVTAVRDALVAAIDLLTKEDPGDTLAFDDADVRALVFITDGEDNASLATEGDVASSADEARVRLYPLVYTGGESVDSSEMLVLAKDSGGHFYSSAQVTDLRNLLANDNGLLLSADAALVDNQIMLTVATSGTSSLNWSITGGEAVDWIDPIVPDASIAEPSISTTVPIPINLGALAPSTTYNTTLYVSSDGGDGTVEITLQTNADGAPSTPEVTVTDAPGLIWGDLRNQIVLTYLTPAQAGGSYLINANYAESANRVISGSFERDGVFFPGQVNEGQLTLLTEGLTKDIVTGALSATAYLRADYVPRNVSRFRVRFFLAMPEKVPDGTAAAFDALDVDDVLSVRIADGGPLTSAGGTSDWRLISGEDGVYDILTEQTTPLPYGAFGRLLEVSLENMEAYVATFDGDPQDPEILLGMRVDNRIYYAPAASGHPSQTQYLVYPGGMLFPERLLSVTTTPALAPPARSSEELADFFILAELPGVWDPDEDGLDNFRDPNILSDTNPGPIVLPNIFRIEPLVDTVSVTVRNNRFDRFSPAVDQASLPAWVSAAVLDFSGVATSGVLLPGESVPLNITVDRQGLSAGFHEGSLLVTTDPFGTEEVNLTLEVSAR
jgi:hypothetical protein